MRHEDVDKTDVALLINGGSLALIISDKELSQSIKTLFSQSKTIVIFRSSPDEKA